MRDLSDVLDLTLTLPIRGKTYVVHPPSAAIGAVLMNRLAIGIAADAGIPLDDEQRNLITVTDDELPDFAHQCLGDTYDLMVADGLSSTETDFAIETAFLAWTVGKAYAQLHWETGGKAGRPTEKSSGPRPTATPTRPAAASTTPTPASASTTRTTRKAPQDRKGRRSPRSGGPTET